MKEKDNIYTAADFAQYHAGTMPANEMHALEKAALEDSFLSDALEGYAYTTTAEKDLTILKEKIRAQEEKKNSFSLIALVNNGWWRIAAVLIIVAGTGYFFYKANDTTNTTTLAKNEDEKKKIIVDTTVTLKYDTSIANKKFITTDQAATYTIREKEETMPITNQPVTAAKPAPSQTMESPAAAPSGISDKAANAAPVAIKKEDAETQRANEFKGQITDDKGTPVPFASIKETNTSKGTSTDADGRFFYKSNDSIVNATASAVGYESKKFNLKKDEEKGIALNKTDRELSEVVVTGLGKRKKRNISNTQAQPNANNALNRKVSGVNVQNNQLANNKSVINEEQFYVYLKNYIAPLFDEEGNKLKGEVTLEFFVNKNKRPENISVKKSTCEACEPIALKLLETGPDWIVSHGEKRMVVIKF